MDLNVKILGWLYIVLGALGLLGGGIALIVLLGTGLLVGEGEVMVIMTLVATFVAGLTLVLSAPGVVTGIGLLNYKPWARILALVLGVLNLPAFPHGTALGVYTLVVLLNEEAAAMFAARR
jgi:hypothetical protein